MLHSIKLWTRFALTQTIVLLMLVAAARASAFSVFENGVRASGMGGAFIAVANDGSALFYNPAGIAFQSGTRMQLDNLGVIGLFRFHPSDTPPGTIVPTKGYNGSVSPHIIPIGNLYATHRINSRLAAGLGVFAPFGLAANFTNFKDSDPANTKYVGRFGGSRAKLESIWFQPTVAFKLTENSAVAFGVSLVHTHLLIEQSILNPLDDGRTFGREVASKIFPHSDPEQAARSIARLLPEGRSRLAGTSNTPGYNFGYLFKHEPSKTNVGFMFRSRVTHKLKGKASFAFTTGYPLESFIGKDLIPDLFPEQPVTAAFVTPATYGVGVANSAFFGSTIAVDFQMQDYTVFKDVAVKFSKTVDTATTEDLVLKFFFRPSYVVRAGLEKRFSDKMVLRTGYVFDYSPVEDRSVGPLFPDSSRHSWTVGASRQFGNMEFSFFYQAMKFMNRTTNVIENNNIFTNGEYRNFAHLTGFGMRMYLGQKSPDFDK